MWFSSRTTKKSLIVSALARKGPLTAKQLQRLPSPRPVSIQAVYKDLRHLEASGIVVRNSGVYSLSFPWLLEIAEFARDASAVYFQHADVRTLLGGNTKRVWRFSDLRFLDSFWMEMILGTAQVTGTKTIFGWIPHPWFDLLQFGKVSRFRDQLLGSGVRASVIIGGDTALDKDICKRWPARLYEWSTAPGPFEGQDSTYVQTVGDYVITVTLDEESVRLVDQVFRKSSSLSSISLPNLNQLLVNKPRASLAVEKSPSKVLKLNRKFVEYFG